MSDLYRHSIEVILRNQAPSGAYIASPAFPQYAYCWLRDGSFIAYAMDLIGEHASAAAFFRWVHRTLQRHAAKAERALASNPAELTPDDYLHTRYTLDGGEASGAWTNFQLDGYGTWLWALREHAARTGDTSLLVEVAPSVDLSVRYLCRLWDRPNFDYWEEFGDKVHPATLASIYGGLVAAQALRPDPAAQATVDAIARFVRAEGVEAGHLVKYLGTDAVDASLLVASTPFRLFAPDDPVMRATVAAIERDLSWDGGVYRYRLDTYYGGGQWILLTAWLGWYCAELGEQATAHRYLAWIEAQADADGDLPEQVSTRLLFPARLAEWEARWGPAARPLLWSHAMYLILSEVLKPRVLH